MANGNFAGGNGTANNPYLIEDAHDLNAIRKNLSAHYKLINDINLDVSPYNEGAGWDTIGGTASSIRFKGSIDGDGYSIKNLYMNRPSQTYKSFVAYVYGNNAVIKNLGFKDVNMKGTQVMGGIACNLRDGGTIKNCYITGSVIGVNGQVGGIVGDIYGENSNIINCYSTAFVDVVNTGTVGGIVASVTTKARVINSFWDKETSNKIASAGGKGLTTTEMKNKQPFIDAGWNADTLADGSKVWRLTKGMYPRLNKDFLNYYLLKSNDSIFTLVDDSWTLTDLSEPLTMSDFENHGVADLPAISKERWDELGDFEILTWTDNEEHEVTTKSANLELNSDYIGSGKLLKVRLDDIVKVNNIEVR